MLDKVKATTQKILKQATGKIVVLALCAVLIMIILVWIYGKSRLNKINCTNMDELYDEFPKIRTVNTNDQEYSYNLRDYYIKTSYNACSAGQFKNDFVNICALKNCIKQGCRCLDLEVYSVDNKPVIATSSVDDYSIKETYNSVPFSSALETIRDYAFSGGTCPNPGDPLIIHLRIMSSNKNIYKTMADNLESMLSSKLLGPKYSYENHGKNLSKLPLKELMGKVVIIADRTNALFEDTELDEYVNLASNSIFMRALRYSDGIKYAPDMDEVVEFNKKCMTICLPDISDSDTNPSAALAMKYGCQMVAMCTQNFDSNMEYYDQVFDSTGSAFVLKPKRLRFVPLVIDKPAPPPKKYSYSQRNVSSDYYAFAI